MINKIYIRLILTCICLLICSSLKAEDGENLSRPVTGVYSLEIGGISAKASYLSPLTYKGTVFSASGIWSKAMPFNPENAVMQFELNANIADMLNPAQTSRMLGLTGRFSWALSWRKHLNKDFQVTLGGGADIDGGAYYLIRNSNNPVQAMANLSLMLTASASRHFRIGRLPIIVADRVNLPSLGIFFCPGYGETYYEIYLGNHKGLAHAGWWGNNFRIDNLLSFSLDFGRTAMLVGYRLNVTTQWANNLNTRIITNSLVVGVIPGGLGLKKRYAKLPDDKIYSIY